MKIPKITSTYAYIAAGVAVLVLAFFASKSIMGGAVLGAVPSAGSLPGIYNATTTDLTLRDGYGSALAVDSSGRVILSPSSSGEFDTLTVGDFTATTATITGISAGDILPSANNTYDVGAFGSAWKDVYASGTARLNTVSVGAGSIGSPAIILGGDADSGLWLHSTDSPSIQSGGSRSFVFGTSNNLTYRDLVPDTTSARDLGATSLKYAEAHVDDIYAYDVLQTGSWTSATDPGSPYPFMRFPLSATPAAGTRNNAIISMGTQYMMSFYGENTGAANAVQNRSVNIYAPRLKFGQANTTNYMYIGTTDGCGALTFTTSSTYPTLTPTSTSFCL